ncbi:type IV secretion protein Rhs [Erwinia sp. OLTSP20]|uniref:type VI secretion system Vgr family protein n=1 Tax=unclassified Erwinia TaxID=2622719 RepID=UPI000C19A219|nr:MULTISPECIES: type VI secretion system tip protein TssI/VgrG [unclassified Erwinia]PIJ48245.1 type IV secretion protein Rhs [Erwinia sp. OAMSP11]PIJ68745.1 type IV secretion protein Rhs [Erwinia sp. OLSSP12]PIJ78920.1 type IV secretion protein Rhs [Erwinia sp. OLCASP19]PIJ79530.1 type IV secretion protein Rhs [Erwinia sp. OLMTSP26]PIJ81488.1 type IV secretion protein Rhs [Erwinia sp. OLMDSP33]
MKLPDSLSLYQENHFLRWNGDIAAALLLVAIKGQEALSSPFIYELRSLTKKSERELAHWHGKAVSCRIGDGSHNLAQRVLHGVVTGIRYRQRTPDEAECILTLEPALSLLKMGRVMRIWQNISVPELVRTLLADHGITQLALQLHGNYSPREYCVQYRESAAGFIDRLLAEEGIYYYFRHSESGHTLVLADHSASHHPISGDRLIWHHHGNIITPGNISQWTSSASLLPASVSLQGVNMPQAAAIDNQQNASGAQPKADTVTWTDITPQGEREQISQAAKQLMAAHEANTRIFEAEVKAHWLTSGETFTFTGHPSGDRSYRIHALHFNAVNNFDGNASDYQCTMQAMVNDQPWQPPAPSRPEIPGILNATVVGPASEEIYTDEYGRIKIQFPWDKNTAHDDTCSCWVRVSQPWSGGQFGVQFIPRIGSEVLVSFVQGHPDYPLVIGTLFNGQNKPPFALSQEKTESGFVTRSTPKGNVSDGHRLSFNDKKGEERLTIVAQKDLLLTVKNDASTTIAANRTTELTAGNDQLLLKKGNRCVALQNGNLQHQISGNASTQISHGNYAVQVTGGSGSITTDRALTLESTQSIELKVGANKISISPSGISINGMMLTLEASATAELKAAMTTVSGSGMTHISGGIINIG